MNQLGYYGKTPHRGDFVRFNLPQSFVTVWDEWLQQVLIEAEAEHTDWADIYQHSPRYRFVLSSGIAGNEVWIGVFAASQDKVGRRFPFCLAMSLDEQALPCVAATAHSHFFSEAESLMTRLLSTEFDFDTLQQELGTMAERFATAAEQTAGLVERPSAMSENAISVNINSSAALASAQGTAAMLDAILMQTISEYSVWICNKPSPVTVLRAGLPTGQAAQSLFRNDWDLDDSRHIPAGPWLLSETSVNASDQSSGSASGIARHHPTSVVAVQKPEADAHGIAPLTDGKESMDSASNPSADDWAALDGFDEGETDVELVVPEVETLELDDDSPDTPWEQ